MGRKQGPRKGSMQIWPRKKAEKFLPRVNWTPVQVSHSHLVSKNPSSQSTQKSNLLGFIGYKVGMASALVKDNTPDSMTKGKKIIVPITVIECPSIKIFSIRMYKGGKVVKDIVNDNLDKDLKRVIKLPKNKVNTKEVIEKIKIEDFDEITLVIYSQPKKAELKKTPDLSEVSLFGNKEDKLEFIKANLGKEIGITDVFGKTVVDVRSVSKGKGFQGAVKRFGIRYRSHKAEKGQKSVGSIGAWHPIGVRFTVPRAGQMGFHSRISYNNTLIESKKIGESTLGNRVFTNYGNVKTDYVILAGSIPGVPKRTLLLTSAFRPTKKQIKKQYELLEIR